MAGLGRIVTVCMFHAVHLPVRMVDSVPRLESTSTTARVQMVSNICIHKALCLSKCPLFLLFLIVSTGDSVISHVTQVSSLSCLSTGQNIKTY